MRRTLALSLLVGSVVAGLGCCKHIAGKCDCTYDPADAVLPGPSNPYFPTGQTFSGPVPPAAAPAKVTEKAPAPPVVVPAEPKKVPPKAPRPTDTIPPASKISTPVVEAPTAGPVGFPTIPTVSLGAP